MARPPFGRSCPRYRRAGSRSAGPGNRLVLSTLGSMAAIAPTAEHAEHRSASLLRTRDLAARTGIPERTIREAVTRGDLSPRRLGARGIYRFTDADAAQLLREFGDQAA